MPYKQRLIEFMRVKASCLPAGLASVYWREEDEEIIRESWDNLTAFRVCKKMFEVFDEENQTDALMCPFCVAAEGHCNKCGYFKLHGCCETRNSDYSFVVDRLTGMRDSQYGIMNYIREQVGTQAIKQLRKIIAADYSSFGPPSPPTDDDGGGTTMSVAA